MISGNKLRSLAKQFKITEKDIMEVLNNLIRDYKNNTANSDFYAISDVTMTVLLVKALEINKKGE